EEYGATETITNTHVFGMMQAVMFAEVLMANGEDLTRQSLVDTLESHEWNGPSRVRFASSDGDHGGHEGVFMVQYQEGGQIDVIQDPRVTDREGGENGEVSVEPLSPDELVLHDRRPRSDPSLPVEDRTRERPSARFITVPRVSAVRGGFHLSAWAGS